MTLTAWQNLENRVREIASMTWGVPCSPREIAGVKLDGVLELKHDHWILIEITENESLAKLRDDLAKFDTVVPILLAKRIYAECFFITAEEPPESIPKSAEVRHVTACSIATFANRFFDFPAYERKRKEKPFGSSFNPFTGEPDTLAYIPVSYSSEDGNRAYNIGSIVSELRQGRNIVLLGDYGTGKSRCVREVFGYLSQQFDIRHPVPVAIDLRHTWGLLNTEEILSRHLGNLGLSSIRDRVISNVDRGAFLFLLDGFDELGSQAWSADSDAVRQLRRAALEGVRDLISRTRKGVLITGRKGYFNNAKEMAESLGLDPDSLIILSCSEEFSTEQMATFLKHVLPGRSLPYWLPKRPLICQVIAEMEPEVRDSVFNDKGGELGFWEQFISMVTKRESWIRQAMTSESVRNILQGLARITRSLPDDFGPISQSDIFGEFRRVLKVEPTAETAHILSRLPGLGLVDADSPSRQFVDRFLLDGLRADDVCSIIENKEYAVCASKWRNPLGGLGQMVISRNIAGPRRREAIAMASRAARDGNAVLSLDVVGSVLRSADDDELVDFGGISVSRGRMSMLDLSSCRAKGLRIHDSEIESLLIDNESHVNLEVSECIIDVAIGVTGDHGLPDWFKDCVVQNYQSVATTSSIRNSHISVQHQILCVIIRKTFFQKGAGRKEAALLRGLGQIDRGGYRQKILKLLIREKILYIHNGTEGLVYHATHADTSRMGQILAELNHSRDPIWITVGEM